MVNSFLFQQHIDDTRAHSIQENPQPRSPHSLDATFLSAVVPIIHELFAQVANTNATIQAASLTAPPLSLRGDHIQDVLVLYVLLRHVSLQSPATQRRRLVFKQDCGKRAIDVSHGFAQSGKPTARTYAKQTTAQFEMITHANTNSIMHSITKKYANPYDSLLKANNTT